MKRKLLATLLALAMVLSLLPAAALAADNPLPASGELTAGTYVLTEDTIASGTITIPAGTEVIINGNSTATLTLSGTCVIEVKGSLTLKDVIIEANSTPGYGAICVTGENAVLNINGSTITQKCTPTGNGYTTSSQIIQIANAAGPSGNAGVSNITISVQDSTLNATHNGTGVRGICFCDASSGTVTLNNSKLYCNGGNFKASYTRGFSTYQDNANRTLNINILNNSEIKGFAYPILNGGGISSKGHIEVNAQDSTFSGWCCAELYGNNNILDFTNCNIVGLNLFGGLSNDYSLFQASYASGSEPYRSSGSKNTITLRGCTLTAATKGDTTATQKIVNFEDDSSVINFRDGTTITQQDTRPALFQVWDENGANGSNAKQFTFDDTVSISGGNCYFSFNDVSYETAVVCDAPEAKVYQGNTGIFTYAPTLGDAVSNANSGDTVTLQAPVNLTETLPIDKDITIDMGSNGEITAQNVRAFHVKGGNLTLTGVGTISTIPAQENPIASGSSVIRVGDNNGDSRTAKLEIGKDITISAPGTYGVTVFGNKTTETVTIAGKINAIPAAAVSGNGSTGYGNTTITIAPTAELTSEEEAAIYHPQSGTLTINGGKITGVGGIEAKAGDTTITMSGNPTVTATGKVNHEANSNGTSTEGYAIAVVENAAYAGGATVTIGSGTYTGAIDIVADNEVASDKKSSISITGGTFSTDPSTYVDGSSITKRNNNTEYVVIPKSDLTEGVYMSDPRTALAEGYTATESNGVWTVAKKTYTVTFDSKGGSAVSSQTVDHGEKVTKPTDPVREGYGFGNWFKDAALTDQFDFNAYTVTNDVILYAKWVPNTYTVSFDSKGGSAVDSQTVSYGEKVTRPDDPTKTGYTFDNWYEGSNEFNFDTYTVTNDVTLYAKWNINTYTVTFNSNGGSAVDSLTVEHGNAITAPAAPTKSGYTFAGWFTDEALTTAYDFATPVTGNVELYAKWNVIYVDDGDSGSSGGSSSTTETTENPDGSTTTTVTDKTTGTVTETTTGKPVTDEAGNTTQTTTEVVTSADGSKTETTTETVTNADGSSSETKTETVTNADGETTSTETVKATDTTGTTATKVTETNAAGESTTSVEATVSDKAVDEAVKGEAPVVLPVEVSATKAEETAAAPVVKVEVPDTVSSESTVKVEIPVENATPGTVAVLVKEDGTEEIIKTSTLGENGVVLTLDGSATVKIVDNSKHFEDVHPVDHWAGDTIDFVSSREIFSGTGKNTFSPDVAMTRAMLMTVLARYDGEDTTTGATWYEKGMDWAKAKGVSDGTNPDANVTREQLATMLYRYAGSPEHNGALDRFPDADAVNSYAADAMRWAVENGIIGGMGDGTLNPQGDATRAEVAAVLARFCGGQTK